LLFNIDLDFNNQFVRTSSSLSFYLLSFLVIKKHAPATKEYEKIPAQVLRKNEKEVTKVFCKR